MDDIEYVKDKLLVNWASKSTFYSFNYKLVMYRYNTPLKQIEVSTIRYIDNE